MKKSHIILLSIILFPSLLYLFFEMTQANFKKMPYYGPKTVNEKGDTVYYSVPDSLLFSNSIKIEDTTYLDEDGNEVIVRIMKQDTTFKIDTTNYPVYVVLFLNDSLKKDGYKLGGIYDYVQYKSNELKNIPMFFVSATLSTKEDTTLLEQHGTFDSLKINQPNIHPLMNLYWYNKDAAQQSYFKGKPYYVFNYFAVLVDKQRHIRGYYDVSQNAEVKRMIQEFKHLKTKDEYANTLKQNEVEKK